MSYRDGQPVSPRPRHPSRPGTAQRGILRPMSVTHLVCPACGAPAPASSGSCVYCGATLQLAPVPLSGAGRPGVGPTRAGGQPGGLVDVVMRGIGESHVHVLVDVLGRPPALMAQVPARQPPVVFGVPPEQALVRRVLRVRTVRGARTVGAGAGGDGRDGLLVWRSRWVTATAAPPTRFHGAPREGSASLVGLSVCGRCGSRMTTSYWGKDVVPSDDGAKRTGFVSGGGAAGDSTLERDGEMKPGATWFMLLIRSAPGPSETSSSNVRGSFATTLTARRPRPRPSRILRTSQAAQAPPRAP